MSNTVKEFSIHAAESFIQTAVFIDDKIYDNARSSISKPKDVTHPPKRKSASRKGQKSNKDDNASRIGTGATDLASEDDHSDSASIVDSFAKKQIVCSLYQPKKNVSYSASSTIFSLCKSADVVIIDWELYHDDGKNALDLIEELILKAVTDVPEQLRLILVYTQDIDLPNVAKKIFQRVSQRIEDSHPVYDDTELAFHTENSRVAVLGKPGRDRVNIPEEFVVKEANLADVAVQQFAKLASGLLHAVILKGLAEIRSNSRKILSRFDSELDPAFLTHRAMLLPQEDASSHIIPLLVSEIESVLEDSLPSNILPDKLLENWCETTWNKGKHLTPYFNQSDIDHTKIAKLICTKGFSQSSKNMPDVNKFKTVGKLDSVKIVREASKLLIPSPSSDANSRFAHLMSTRTSYKKELKSLQLGTVVYQEDSENYHLCVQPICDSVRLKKEHVFLFLQLELESEQERT